MNLFAENLDNPRLPHVLPNGDVVVVESTREWPDRPDRSAKRLTLIEAVRKGNEARSSFDIYSSSA